MLKNTENAMRLVMADTVIFKKGVQIKYEQNKGGTGFQELY